jgi:hypothetical protein
MMLRGRDGGMVESMALKKREAPVFPAAVIDAAVVSRVWSDLFCERL